MTPPPNSNYLFSVSSTNSDDANISTSNDENQSHKAKSSLELAEISEFDVAAGDVRRIWETWLSGTRRRLAAAWGAIESERATLAEERRNARAEIEQLRKTEDQRVEAARARLQQEAASVSRQIAADRELVRRQIVEEKLKFDDENKAALSELKFRQQSLQMERARFVEAQAKVHDMALASQDRLQFNVGGEVFETTRDTLNKLDSESLLRTLSEGRFESTPLDSEGRIFLDRDPDLFRPILAYLRSSTRPLPRDKMESRLLADEFLFYGARLFGSNLAFVVGGCSESGDILSAVEMVDFGGSKPDCRTVTSLETARAHFGLVSWRWNLYVSGGHNAEYRSLCDVEMYDPLLNVWHSSAPMVVPRRGHACCVANARIYSIGGFDGGDITSSVECFDPRDPLGWKGGPAMNVPRCAAAAVPFGEYSILVVGGTSGARTASCEVLDLRREVWTPLDSELKQPRSGHKALAHNGQILVLGGLDPPTSTTAELFETSDDLPAIWRSRALEGPSPEIAACMADSRLIIVAGGGTSPSQIELLDDLFEPKVAVTATLGVGRSGGHEVVVLV